MAECGECRGRRHVLSDSGLWVACKCLAEKRARARYARAMLHERHLGLTWREFLADYRVDPVRRLVEVARDLKQGTLPAWLHVTGRPLESLDEVAGLLVRSACDGGLEGRVIGLQQLVDAEFQGGRGSWVNGVEALAVVLGPEPPHSWNRVVLEKHLRDRWLRCRWTALLTLGSVGGYGSVLLERTLRERCTRVEVRTCGTASRVGND